MIGLGVDFETGEDFKKGKEENFITEVGLALKDYSSGKGVLIDSTSILVNCGKPLHHKAIELTGITQDMIDKYGQPLEYALSIMDYYASRANFLIAHNADFDRYYWERDMNLFGKANAMKHWVDTMKDVPYPDTCYDRSLMYISAYHKIINFNDHRALPDVYNMLTVLDEYDIKEVYNNSLCKEVAIVAMITREETEKVKRAGKFRWYSKDDANAPAEHLRGWWVRIIKEWEVQRVIKSYDFPYEIRNI